MKKPKRITPEQYVILAKLGMPTTCVSRYSSEMYNSDEAIVTYLLDERVQRNNMEYCDRRAKHDYLFYTLVDTDEEA